MRGARRLIAVRALPLLLVLAATQPAFAGILAVGDPAVELDTAQDDSGKSFKLKQVDGWRVVTIGADWCKPCHKELKAWDRLAGDNGKVTFITIAIDNDVKDGKRLHKDLKIKHMKRVYMPADKTAVAVRYGSAVMPTTFVIDPEGRVRHVHKGYDPGDEDKLKKALAKLVK
ncbi:MAG: TlpA family protein disulfide reductase [Deltaproteobacteria bacterium]|nr:TlpA family protein disulfide reductase [Deltaproteobacteria bacterium]